MKKAFVRAIATVGIVSSALAGSSVIGNMRALALPQAQILEKLQSIPVFAITDAQGSPLVASVNEGQKKSAVTGVFISQRDALAFIERLKTQNPNLAKTVKVVPVSLGEVYKLDQTNRNKPDSLNFAYVPAKQQVDSAMTILRQGGQQVQQFNGVPLFVAKAGQDKGYLTIQQGDKQMIPFFFEKEQLQTMVDRFKQQQPNQASTIQIQAVTLEGVMDTLQKSNDQQLNNIVLVPSREALDFLKTQQPGTGTTNNQLRPATAPQRR